MQALHPRSTPLTRFTRPSRALPLALLLAAACRSDGPPALAPGDVLAAERALGAGSSGTLSVSPEGRRLLVASFEAAAFGLAVAERGTGRVLAMDRRSSKHVAAAWRADGNAVAFFADSQGVQRYSAYVLELASGKVRRLDVPYTRVPPKSRWAPRGSFLAYVATQPRRRDLVVVNTAEQPEQPWTLVRGLAPYADIAWSPDGGAVATIQGRSPGTVVVAAVDDGRLTRIPVAADMELRDLAWAPAGGAMLVTGRRAGDEFFRLFELDVARRTVREVAREAAGDVSDPLYHPGGGFAYHSSVDGRLQLTYCASGEACRALGPAGGRTALVDFARDSAVVVHTGLTEPPRLYAVPLRTGSAEEVGRRRSGHGSGPAIRGERIDIASRDGLRVPAYLWRPPNASGPTSALVRVHGGPAAQATPVWDPGIQYLVRAGFHVIQLNYRGSTGYGARFEQAPGGDSARVLDVLAARDHAVRALGVSPGRVVVYGHSYGALLAAGAAAREPKAFAAVVLVSLSGEERGFRPAGWTVPREVFAFHGERDPLPPEHAADQLRRQFGRRAPVRLHVFENEGHSFQRIESWAEVYANVAALLGRMRS